MTRLCHGQDALRSANDCQWGHGRHAPARPGSRCVAGAIFVSAFLAAGLVVLAALPSLASVVNCQADRPGANNVIYLYYSTTTDDNYPNHGEDFGATTQPLQPFDVADLDPDIGTTAQLRDAVTERVKIHYCEFDVRVVQTTSANGTTDPNPTDPRWQVLGIGSDTAPETNGLFGIAQDVDIGDNTLTDFARVFAGAFDAQFGGAGGALAGADSTLERWANAIAGTTAHEAGHNYGLAHGDSVSLPTEDARQNHVMASGQADTGGLTGADRVRARHFSNTSFEILAANIGLFEQTLSNWDFINPNDTTADGFRITVLVLPGAGTPSTTSVYTGGLSPWNNVTISADGTEMFKGTQYNRFQIDFVDPKSWNNGDPGEVGPGVSFHVGVGLTEQYIVRNTLLSNGGTPLELRPRVVGYSTEGSFDPETGNFHVTFSNPDPEDGPLLLSDFVIRHIPRTVDINQMVATGSLIGIDGLPIQPWRVRGSKQPVTVEDTADVALANLSEKRAVDRVLDKDPACVPGVKVPPPIPDSHAPVSIEYCPEGHVLGLFPSARVYFEATVTDPDARFFDANAGEFVTGPLRSRIFVQLPGAVPDLNENGVDDAIDFEDGTCTDLNANGVCDQAEPPRFKSAAKIVCGVQDDPADMRLVQGVYATAINILNPNAEKARFTKKLSLTYPPDGQRPGEVMPLGRDTLGPDQALEVDCSDVQRKLFPNGFPTGYIKGFVVITSSDSLDVTAVYSTRSLDKPCCRPHDGDSGWHHHHHHGAHHPDGHHHHGSPHGHKGGLMRHDGDRKPDYAKPGKSMHGVDVSIDVEQIRERKIETKKPPVRQCTDLVVRDIGRPDVRCPKGAGSCRTTVDIDIANIGNKRSGAFDLRTVFDPSQSVSVGTSVPAGLAAGEDRRITVATPPGRNCFDPDCTVSATVDSTNAVEECNERNNARSETTPG